MEQWKVCIENDTYEVSNYGNVRHTKTKKVRKLRFDSHGYTRLNFSNMKTYHVHRLVANAFIPKVDNHNVINHIDNNPSNNNVENLEWSTPLKNSQHSVLMNAHYKGEQVHTCKISEKDAIDIKYNSKGINTLVLSKKYNVARCTINDIQAGRSWKHI